MQLAHREMLSPGVGGLALGMAVYFLVQHTLTGPLGTGQTMNWTQRLGYWGVVALLQGPISYACCVLALYVARHRRPLEIAAVLAIMVLILAGSCAAIVLTVYGLFLGSPPPDFPVKRVYRTCAINVSWGTALLYYVLWIRLRRNLAPASEADAATTEAGSDDPETATGVRPAQPAAPAPTTAAYDAASGDEPGTTAGTRFFDRLPDELGRDIIYIAAAAHYVDVVTSTGSASILLRFSDAAAELGDLGMRVHRSYWVAYRHVKHAMRRDGRTLLLLTGDHEVRVGRNFLPDVRAAVPKAWIRARRRTTFHSPSESETSSS